MLATLVCALGVSALNADTIDAYAQNGSLYINEVKVLELKAWLSGMSPAKRAEVVAQRINGLKNDSSFMVSADGVSNHVSFNGTHILIIEPREAEFQKSTVEALTLKWTNSMREAMMLPAFVIPKQTYLSKVGSTITIPVTGSKSRNAKINIVPADAVKVTKQPGKLLVQPLKDGSSSIRLTNGSDTKTITIVVQPSAATFPQTLQAEIYGLPAEEELFKSSVLGAIQTQLGLKSTQAQISVDSFQTYQTKPGDKKKIKVRVTVEADGFAPSSGDVWVEVSNIGVGKVFEDQLWFSNVPENLKDKGQLYYGALEPSVPVRMLIHHCNKSTQQMLIQYVLINESNVPSKVALIAGDVSQHSNPTLAGYQTGASFFKRWLNHSAQIVTVPPNSAVPLVLDKADAGNTVSGLLSMRLLEGGSGKISVVGTSSWNRDMPRAWMNSYNKKSAWTFARPLPLSQYPTEYESVTKEVYANPNREVAFEYIAGVKHSFVRIGQDAISATVGDGKLLGNFGANYTLKGMLENPTDQPVEVEVLFEASAGYSGAIFSVNGKVVDGRLLQTKEKFELYKTQLPAKSNKEITIQTIPLSGAHYPATIIVQPAGFDSGNP